MLAGYKRLKGTAERVRTPTGKTISRRQYDNLVKGNRYHREVEKAKSLGYRSLKERYETKRSSQWKEYWEFQIKQENVANGRNKNQDLQELRVKFAEVQRIRKEHGSTERARFDPRMRDPDGPLSALLVASGIREDGSQYDVGDSPKGSK